MRRTLIVGAVTMAIGLASVPMAMAITFGEPDDPASERGRDARRFRW